MTATDPRRHHNAIDEDISIGHGGLEKSLKSRRYKAAIEVVGILSVVASLIFVGFEIRQSGRAANDASMASDASIVAEIESLVLSNPDVWRRGCEGEDLEPTEALIYSHIHHASMFQYFLRWLRDIKGLDVASAELSIDNLAMNIYRNPGFAREWNAHGASRHHVSDEADMEIFRRLVDDRVAEFSAFEPTPLDFSSRCGLN